MSKYQIANRCPYGLPKTTSGKQWIKLVAEGGPQPKLGGIVIAHNRASEVVVAVVGYFGAGAVLMIDMAVLPGSRFERTFNGDEAKLLQHWHQDWMSGKYKSAVDAFNRAAASGTLFVTDIGTGYGF